ncbi:putative TIR domain, AAA+ ATPase domain, P-loop containing nucleoside triphosphate hydrolase [Helianthus debilis subsp. tardiflorus]
MMLPYASSSSSSSTTVSQCYDVFMSFRGEDTRMTFTSHLYDALIQNGIITYKDDRTLELGKPIAPELLQAIETSKIAVVILSRQYATSKWCLQEIAKIVDCMKLGKLIVIPIFYHVTPSDVRHQSDCFEQAFSNHDANTEIAPGKVNIWRAAFVEVGALSGSHVTKDKDEAKVVRKVVSQVLSYLSNTMPLDLSKSLVGIESRVDEVKNIMRMESSEVLFIGICGMSGVGKTTLAEAVYKDIKRNFKKSSIIENIKDISKQNDSADLCRLQQKLLDDILMDTNTHAKNVIDGQTLLGSKLRGLKVIIVLDDVNHVDQLTYLARGLEWFGPGSRIIVTTTNRDLLNYYKKSEIYFCEEMKDDEALGLFCQSAFKQSRPTHGYEKLSNDIVKLAGGLPLALNVYGSLLCGKDEKYWKGMLEKLREYPEKEVLGRLEVVYARLDRDQRDAFIYIACFLKGRHKDLVNDILTSIGLHPECGITDLINKCLITINLEDSVWMHDLLQQMCWKILCGESNLRKHIAMKFRKDVVDVLSNNPKGKHTVEVINQEPYKVEINDQFTGPMCLLMMKKLKFLRISNVHFPEGLNYLSDDIRIIEWYGCSLESFPPLFQPKHIFEVEMCSSQLKTLWTKDLELPNLRSINLSFSKNLTCIPNLTSALNLEKLNLEGCTNLTSLHESVLLLKRLRYLNLKGCACLQSLGRSHMEMEALEALLLSGCSKLEYIPEFGKNMKRLEHLYVDGTRIKKLPENLGEMCDLRNLDASGTFIEELPLYIYGLKKLRLLHVNRCRLSFKTGCFLNPNLHTLSSSLKEVDLSYCNLSVVPDGIGLLLTLPKLSLVDEDMDYGSRSRFNYYVSAEGVDLSRFRASSYNYRPTVSCLNCPKLAVDKNGSYLAEKVLNSYLELRTDYWMTPEAVFEIVGARSEIPSGFVQPGPGGLILEGRWVGVAICVVIAVHHFDGYMEANHMITACIRLGAKDSKISIPVNFLVAESETQLVFYLTIVDALQRNAGSNQYWGNFDVSFSVEPVSNLQVTKVGVRFIREEYIKCLTRHEDSRIRVGKGIRYLGYNEYTPYMNVCKDDINLHIHTQFLVDSICYYEHYSLDHIYQITEVLLKINPRFF